DVSPVLAVARREAPYPVLAPVNLPAQWRPTKVAWEPVGRPALDGEPSPRNAWRLGYLNPNDVYVALEQGDRAPNDLVRQATREGRVDGSSTVSGVPWERRVSPDGRTRALVLTSPAVTSVVAGDVSYGALEDFAATLRDR
ncbi:MAG: DUF4245 domain-containing protein, partial [Actinomycetes bacterium]